jgi:hypothetical protein
MNAEINHSFKLYLTQKRFAVMFSQLNNGQYTKTYMKNGRLEIDFITPQEFSYALTYDTLYSTYP